MRDPEYKILKYNSTNESTPRVVTLLPWPPLPRIHDFLSESACARANAYDHDAHSCKDTSEVKMYPMDLIEECAEHQANILAASAKK